MDRPGSLSSLDDWLGWLETLSPSEIELGLERVAEVLERLQLRNATRVIHVAGTNGKGSSVAMLESLYMQRSRSVGCYTSPHVHAYNERIRFAGKTVSDRRILQAFARVESVRRGIPLTYFEYGTLAALCVFDAVAAETLILEVGMGGRLDAVNAIEPDGGVITNISLDHCAWLGDDTEKIGAEKAGIFRPGKPFVFAAGEMPRSIEREARKTGAELWRLDRHYRYSIGTGGQWDYVGRNVTLTSLPRPALQGDFQIQNAAGVIALLEALQDTELLAPDIVQASFAGLTLPGRFQSLQRHGLWIVDVAHNAAAAAALAEALGGIEFAEKSVCIIGVLGDKEIAAIAEPLLPYVDCWIAATAHSPRAIAAAELARQIANISGKPCLIADSIGDACETAAAIRRVDAPVVVTGSFLTVGPALEWLG